MRTPLRCLALVGCATTSAPPPATPSAVVTHLETSMNRGPEWLRAGGPSPTLDHHHVLFVAGFLSELIPGDCTDNVAVSRELGAGTSVVFPPSKSTPKDDCDVSDGPQLSTELTTPTDARCYPEAGLGCSTLDQSTTVLGLQPVLDTLRAWAP